MYVHTQAHTHTCARGHTHTHTHRGLSSTVRKCVSRETGIEYAVKIIDKSQDEAITESIQAEIDVLNSLPHHKHISESVWQPEQLPVSVYGNFTNGTAHSLCKY